MFKQVDNSCYDQHSVADRVKV